MPIGIASSMSLLVTRDLVRVGRADAEGDAPVGQLLDRLVGGRAGEEALRQAARGLRGRGGLGSAG
jgi:hypothetical protein